MTEFTINMAILKLNRTQSQRPLSTKNRSHVNVADLSVFVMNGRGLQLQQCGASGRKDPVVVVIKLFHSTFCPLLR